MLTQSKKKSILFKQIDNFFEDPQSVVELSQSLDYFGYDDNQGYGVSSGRYAGKRTNELHLIAPDFFGYASNKIAESVYGFSKIPNLERCTWRCSMYFSLLMSSDKPSKDSPIKIIHQDSGVDRAGLVYLSKRINQRAGTSFYDSNHRRIKEAKNKYNRLITYEGSNLHSISKFVDNRLVLLFFFKGVKHTYV
tara:strand:- start:115 stop:693 length:579 start_codon:yes stop_codon:yes gene_type:complete